MALLDGFLTPLGFAALAAAVPLVVLYLVQPKPKRYRLPTLRFLSRESGQSAASPLLERLRRSLLLLLQLLAIVTLATSLAAPYALVDENSTVRESVLVVDASASMGVQTGEGTRFEAARSAALEDITDTTSVVVSGGDADVAVRAVGRQEAQSTLDSLSVEDAEGDLASAVSSAAAIASEGTRIVVYSDFADDSAWREAVETTRARGLRVDLAQFAGGGTDNVGIVDRSFSGNEVTVSVKNYAESETTRTISLGDRRETIEFEPGDVATRTFEVPAGGGRISLSPGDSFPTDDTYYLAAPEEPTVRALVVTNDPNRHLITALEVVDNVDVTVASPPTTIEEEYDVIVYSNVDPDRLLRSSVQAGRDVIARGGGIVVQSQAELPAETYGDLLVITPDGEADNPTVASVADDELTRDISFTPPDTIVTGDAGDARSLVTTTDGDTLLATAERGPGRVMYYGYVDAQSSFKYNYQYPVFWKRAAFWLAGRQSLPSLNRAAGERLTLDEETTVRTPSEGVTGTVVPLTETGFYETDRRRYGVSLVSERESNVVAPDVSEAADGSAEERTESSRVPLELTPYVALAALLVVVLEVAYLRRRGDL